MSGTIEADAITEAVRARIAIDLLLDDPVPDDWRDPDAVMQRRDALRAAARHAGAMTVELFVRLRDERHLGIDMRPEGCAMVASSSHVNLHCSLARYRHDVPQHNDGWDLAREAIAAEYGAGIAAFTLRGITMLRGLLSSNS
jgi:hypothetical protein